MNTRAMMILQWRMRFDGWREKRLANSVRTGLWRKKRPIARLLSVSTACVSGGSGIRLAVKSVLVWFGSVI